MNRDLKRRRRPQPKFVLCIKNKDCEDLEVRKIYRVLPDRLLPKTICFESLTSQEKTICIQLHTSWPLSSQARSRRPCCWHPDFLDR